MATATCFSVSRHLQRLLIAALPVGLLLSSCATAPKKAPPLQPAPPQIGLGGGANGAGLGAPSGAAPQTSRRAPASVEDAREMSVPMMHRMEPGSGQGTATSGGPGDGGVPSKPPETLVTVHFGTNRTPLPGATLEKPPFFDSHDDGKIHYGSIQLAVDQHHSVGSLDGISFSAKPELKDQQRFLRDLKKDLAASKEKKLLIFVHGYNVTFEDAARRTAQLKHDLEFQGEAAFYSWPSRGKLLGYWADEKEIKVSEPFLQEFLTTIVKKSDARKIYIIAHSMGNRAFTSVFPKVRDSLNGAQSVKEIMLAAPDINAKVFTREIAPKITAPGHGTTLYCSNKDKALWASWLIHFFHPRAGQRPAELPGTESVDASSVDTSVLGLGHSYYAEQSNLLKDMNKLINGQRAPQRTETLELMKQRQAAWELRKQLAGSAE
jgi:esterase/lipase superfamily enzyme